MYQDRLHLLLSYGALLSQSELAGLQGHVMRLIARLED